MLYTLLAALFFLGVNVNTASQTDLETLPGIGPSKAMAIIEYRTANGPFTSLAELDAVPGIGPATLENISPQVEFGGEDGGEDGSLTTKDLPETTNANKPPPAARTGKGVNINTANQSQLESLPGIGPAKSRAIIEDREANGPFANCSDLTRVNGVGDATVKTIGDQCVVASANTP